MNTVLAVLLLLSNAASQTSVPRPVRVAGPGYEGAIVSAHELLLGNPQHVTLPASFWTPTEAEIRDVEERIRQFLRGAEATAALGSSRVVSELTRYFRQ